jgi:hypothetical protein
MKRGSDVVGAATGAEGVSASTITIFHPNYTEEYPEWAVGIGRFAKMNTGYILTHTSNRVMFTPTIASFLDIRMSWRRKVLSYHHFLWRRRHGNLRNCHIYF